MYCISKHQKKNFRCVSYDFFLKLNMKIYYVFYSSTYYNPAASSKPYDMTILFPSIEIQLLLRQIEFRPPIKSNYDHQWFFITRYAMNSCLIFLIISIQTKTYCPWNQGDPNTAPTLIRHKGEERSNLNPEFSPLPLIVYNLPMFSLSLSF